MECFYDKEGPVWIAGDNEFESEVMAVINRLCDNTKAESTANELAWFFVVSFSYTWFRLLLTSCRTPAIIPSLIKVATKWAFSIFGHFYNNVYLLGVTFAESCHQSSFEWRSRDFLSNDSFIDGPRNDW